MYTFDVLRNIFKKYGILLLFLISYLAFALLTYKDYGITSDEELEYRATKHYNAYYVNLVAPDSIDEDSLGNIDSRHLPENSTYFRGHLSPISFLNNHDYYEWNHLYNFIFPILLFILLYLYFYKVTKSPFLASIPLIFLVFLPRFLGHIPANPKDVPFAVMYASTFLLFMLFRDNLNWKKSVLLGVFLGFTVLLRFVGIGLFPLLILFMLLSKFSFKRVFKHSVSMLIPCLLVIYIFLPILHNDTLNNFILLFTNAQSFDPWDGSLLFQGNFYDKYSRPQSYLPVWLFITTPIYLMVLSVIPLILLLRKKRDLNPIYLYTLIVFGFNLILYYILRPTIYNGLRHFLYLLPLIVILSTHGFISLFKILNGKFKLFMCLAVLIDIAFLLVTFIKLHPYEYVYFNEISGGLEGAYQKYDMDYWGASYKEGTQWLVDNGSFGKDTLTYVYSCNLSNSVRYYSDFAFDLTSDRESAIYTLCTTEDFIQSPNTGEIIHTVSRFGTPLLYVLKN